MTQPRYAPWPENDEPAAFEEISEPIIKAIRFAYRLVRRNKTKDIPWSGLDLGQNEKVTCSRPMTKLTADHLAFALEDQGRDALEEIVSLAIQLGIEQGRRMEITRQKEWDFMSEVHDARPAAEEK